MDQVFQADVSIVKSSECGSDIEKGSLTQSDVEALLPGNPSLVVATMTSADVTGMLEKAVDAAIAGIGSGAYPYAGALRFDVNAAGVSGMRSAGFDRVGQGWWGGPDDGGWCMVGLRDLRAAG